MLGLLRTVLALMVAIHHLFIWIYPLGHYPVFGFYVISGFLMTLIMHRSYGYSTEGRGRFLVNRFLRLFPQYWAAATLSILLIILIGQEVILQFNGAMILPDSLSGVLANLTMVFPTWRPNEFPNRLVSSTWALTVEMAFYVLICLGISKNAKRTLIWVSVSALYVLVTFLMGLPKADRYFPIAAGSLPFAIGALIYFLPKGKLAFISAKTLFWAMLLNCVLFSILVAIRYQAILEVGTYINLALCSLLVYKLASGNPIFNIGRSIDDEIGKYSYPIYLLHWQAGAIASFLIFGRPMTEFSILGFLILVASMIVLAILSKFTIRWIDEPIQKIRSAIKKK